MKLVEYDRLARRPCRGRAAKVDHLSDVRVTSAQQAETPSTDPYPAETELQNIGCHKDCFGPCKHG